MSTYLGVVKFTATTVDVNQFGVAYLFNNTGGSFTQLEITKNTVNPDNNLLSDVEVTFSYTDKGSTVDGYHMRRNLEPGVPSYPYIGYGIKTGSYFILTQLDGCPLARGSGDYTKGVFAAGYGSFGGANFYLTNPDDKPTILSSTNLAYAFSYTRPTMKFPNGTNIPGDGWNMNIHTWNFQNVVAMNNIFLGNAWVKNINFNGNFGNALARLIPSEAFRDVGFINGGVKMNWGATFSQYITMGITTKAVYDLYTISELISELSVSTYYLHTYFKNSISTLRSRGIQLSEFKTTGLTPYSLKSEYSLKELIGAGYSLYELGLALYTAKEIKDAYDELGINTSSMLTLMGRRQVSNLAYTSGYEIVPEWSSSSSYAGYINIPALLSIEYELLKPTSPGGIVDYTKLNDIICSNAETAVMRLTPLSYGDQSYNEYYNINPSSSNITVSGTITYFSYNNRALSAYSGDALINAGFSRAAVLAAQANLPIGAMELSPVFTHALAIKKGTISGNMVMPSKYTAYRIEAILYNRSQQEKFSQMQLNEKNGSGGFINQTFLEFHYGPGVDTYDPTSKTIKIYNMPGQNIVRIQGASAITHTVSGSNNSRQRAQYIIYVNGHHRRTIGYGHAITDIGLAQYDTANSGKVYITDIQNIHMDAISFIVPNRGPWSVLSPGNVIDFNPADNLNSDFSNQTTLPTYFQSPANLFGPVTPTIRTFNSIAPPGIDEQQQLNISGFLNTPGTFGIVADMQILPPLPHSANGMELGISITTTGISSVSGFADAFRSQPQYDQLPYLITWGGDYLQLVFKTSDSRTIRGLQVFGDNAEAFQEFVLPAPESPTEVSATTLSSSSASVSFTPSSGATSYTVTTGSITATGTSSPITVTGLSPSTSYTFTVTATNITGTSPSSTASSAIITLPVTPTGVSATTLSPSSASVSFTGSADATSYTVTSSPGSITATGTSSPITITGLSPSTSYTFTVTSTSLGGTSPSSTASSAIITFPRAPTGVSATTLSTTSASVSFTGSTGATSYTVNTGSITVTGTSSPIIVTGLSPSTSYTFTITATNSGGTSPSVASSSITTFTAITQANIQTAVNAWIANPTTAQSTYGHIKDWDTSSVSNMSNLFNNKQTFNDDISLWNTSNVTSMEKMFYKAYLFNQNISTKDAGTYTAWDTSNVTSMADMFNMNTSNLPNGNFNNGQAAGESTAPMNWNTSKVTTFAFLFRSCRKFNQNCSTASVTVRGVTYNAWDTSKVTDMTRTFAYCESFNNGEPRGSSTKPLYWNTSNVTTMNFMFGIASSFILISPGQTMTPYNQRMTSEPVTIGGITYTPWDVSKVTNMFVMFQASSFNQPLNSWNVSSVTNMNSMFAAAATFNQPLNSWNVSAVTDIGYMFSGATAFNGDISSWNVSAVTYMGFMFNGASAFNGDISSWNVSKVTDMYALFQNAVNFNININLWDVSKITNMSYMFHGATAFNQPLNLWNVSAVTSMYSMFSDAAAFNQSLDSWNVSAVTDMTYMFSGATAFNQPLNPSWDVSAVTNMGYMFFNATSFNQSLNSWDVSAVADMSFMFYMATAFNKPLNLWDVSAVEDMTSMFYGATSFNQEIKDWDVSNVMGMESMFNGATRFNRNLARWVVGATVPLTNMFKGTPLGTNGTQPPRSDTPPLSFFNQAPCFDQDTMILCPTGNICVKDLKVCDEVVTPSGVKRILRIANKTRMFNDTSNTSTTMYRMKKTDHMTGDLLVTGAHAILLDSPYLHYHGDGESFPEASKIDGKYPIIARLYNKFERETIPREHTIYHISVDGEKDRYGLVANGILMESWDKKQADM